jgi:D-glycero-alpha-D-manno-heptose-7-phosphate kinase
LTQDISSSDIDGLYDAAIQAGALGGKLLGAGGGGFLLFYVEPQNQQKVIEAMGGLYRLPIRFDQGGARITYYDQQVI